MMRSVRRGIVAALVAVGLASTACGIPTGSGPTAIARTDVPFHLLVPTTGSTTTTAPPTVGSLENIYLVAPNQHVVAVSRDVAVPASLSDILHALLEGPTAEEAAAGLQSFLIPTVQVSATVSGGIATVNFSAYPVQVLGADQTLAIAQVVFTAIAAQPGTILGVSFQIAGQPVAVPTAQGQEVTGPVGPAAYQPQAPLAP